MENKVSLAIDNDQIMLNYFTNDQSKHIDYVIQYDDESLDLPLDRKTRRNKNIIKRKHLRNKFLLQLITEEKFEIHKLVKKIDDKKTSNYLLLHCSLERISKEAERMKMEMPVKNVTVLILIFIIL